MKLKDQFPFNGRVGGIGSGFMNYSAVDIPQPVYPVPVPSFTVTLGAEIKTSSSVNTGSVFTFIGTGSFIFTNTTPDDQYTSLQWSVTGSPSGINQTYELTPTPSQQYLITLTATKNSIQGSCYMTLTVIPPAAAIINNEIGYEFTFTAVDNKPYNFEFSNNSTGTYSTYAWSAVGISIPTVGLQTNGDIITKYPYHEPIIVTLTLYDTNGDVIDSTTYTINFVVNTRPSTLRNMGPAWLLSEEVIPVAQTSNRYHYNTYYNSSTNFGVAQPLVQKQVGTSLMPLGTTYVYNSTQTPNNVIYTITHTAMPSSFPVTFRINDNDTVINTVTGSTSTIVDLVSNLGLDWGLNKVTIYFNIPNGQSFQINEINCPTPAEYSIRFNPPRNYCQSIADGTPVPPNGTASIFFSVEGYFNATNQSLEPMCLFSVPISKAISDVYMFCRGVIDIAPNPLATKFRTFSSTAGQPRSCCWNVTPHALVTSTNCYFALGQSESVLGDCRMTAVFVDSIF